VAEKLKDESHKTARGTNPNSIANLKPFKSGSEWTGNAGGRPKKKPITSAYARAVDNPADADKLAKALFEKACAGDVNAAKELREGIEGKALQGIRLDGELGVTSEADRKSRVLDILREGAQRIEKVQ
jgi:hypothetical protein